MAVINVDHVYFCCLYGNSENETIIRHITRDKDYEEELIALEYDYWHNHILARVPPPYCEDGDLILESVKNHYGTSLSTEKNSNSQERNMIFYSGWQAIPGKYIATVSCTITFGTSSPSETWMML